MLGWQGKIREGKKEKVINLRRDAKGNLQKYRKAPQTSSWELKMQKVEQPVSSSNIYKEGKSKHESSRPNPHKISPPQDLHHTAGCGG